MVPTALKKKKKKKEIEHLPLSCGAGEVPGCRVVSEAIHRVFVLSCCHFLTEKRWYSRPLGSFFSSFLFPRGPFLTPNW